MSINLLPQPKALTWLDNHCEIAVSLPSAFLIDSPAITGINEIFNAQLGQQVFHLSILPDAITLTYADAAARLYGLNLLSQIAKQCASDNLPCVYIEDAPDFLHRGIILDISRDKVPTLAALFQLIDLWSTLRINKLQLYTEHTFAYQAHQDVWKNASPYSGEDIQCIDRYCLSKGIELVINQATFGHMERWLQHPQYQYLAEQTAGFIDQRGDFRPFSFGLNPLGEQSRDFIQGLLDELVPYFSSKTININFDETMDLGVDASRLACESQGKGEVYVAYLNKLLTITQAKGLHTQIFSDMLFHYPEILQKLPKNLTLLNWGYEANHPFDKEHQQLQQTGLPFEVVVSTCCFASITGRWQNAQAQMLNGARSGLKFAAQGYHISEWGDMGHAQQSCMPIAGYIYGASLAWGVENNARLDCEYWLKTVHCDGEPLLAKWILKLQNIYLTTAIDCPNCAFIGPLIFDQRSARHIKHSTGLTEQGFNNSIALLDICLTELAPLADSYLKAQLLWSAKILKHGCLLGAQLVLQGTLKAEQLSLQTRQSLCADLLPLMDEYARLWRIENREGGLADSLGRLQYLQRLYMQ